MLDEDDVLGESLEVLSEGEPPPLDGQVSIGDGVALQDLAAAAPYARRLAAVHRAAGADGVRIDDALAAAEQAASMHRHRLGSLSDRNVLTYLLGAAIDTRLLRIDTAADRLHPGEEVALIADHPLAAWGESLPLVVHRDPLGLPDRATETCTLLPLLYQYLVRSRDPDLEACVPGLHREMTSSARRRGARAPSRRDVRRQVAALTALLEEFGVVSWQPAGARLGTARLTFLGAFGWMVLICDLQGPTPAMDRMIQDAGYLPAAGGYVHRSRLPVDLCDN